MSVSKRELAAYLGEVEEELAKLTAVVKPPKWKAENYVGAGVSRYRYLEVKIPDVRARLKRGFSFADLAAEYSDDPSLAEVGGIISAGGQECLPTDQWNLELLDELRAERVVVGKPGVIVLNNAEVVVLLRPYDELTAESHSTLAQGPVSDALLALYQSAEVTVNESIGTWDAEKAVVVEASETSEASSDH